MNTEMNLILLSIMITCAAFIGAVNSKGASRMIVSYILAFVCLAITAFKTTQYTMSLSIERDKKITAELGKTIENKLEMIEEKEGIVNQEEVNKYMKDVGSLVYKMKQITGKLSRFQLEADTDDEYEELQNKASYYLGEVKRYKSQVASLTAPSGMESIHEVVTKASDNLVYACSKLRRYFNAEDSQEELELSRIFRSKNNQAASLLNQAATDLQ
jgi:hypothetical protein